MSKTISIRRVLAALLIGAAALPVLPALAQTFEPTVGQAGKDVVWVPTPQALVEKMLDLAKISPQDLHYDLGSGDGRTVITAAKRGARSMGIEYNPEMVALSQKNAADAGVTERATFVQADLFETDFSKANVVTLFLLPSINMKLRPKILDMAPGTRIVANTFTMEDWKPDQTETISGDCVSWCTALLWIVPAKAAGTWQIGSTELILTQNFQMLEGTFGGQAIADAKVTGNEVAFTVGGGPRYTGTLKGNTITGTITGGSGGSFTATRK
ncbi:MAG TPA: class I SAM-dependent methyltransferase [Thermoleophilia bacterium]|nr:class I SAM-dependent methyltransferase [Thermoleophilia bacterium]